MYFWRVDLLVKDLKEGNFSQKEEFKYMLFFTLLSSLLLSNLFSSEFEASNYYEYILIFLTLLVSAIGLYFCYKVNSQNDNKDFIVRVMCLGLPIAIKLTVFIFPLGMVFYSIMESHSDIKYFSTNLTDAIFFTIYTVLYYWYLYTKMEEVAIS